MLGNQHFYNRTIRKVVVAFGTMFNDIQLVRYSKDGRTAFEVTKVPLSYGPKEKYITRITSDPEFNKSIATVVPRMSFDMTGMSYDSSRKQISTMRNFSSNTNTALATQFAPVPYNFEFSLSIYVRNTEDGTQILEQILPFFTPDFTVTIDFISQMEQKYDMPVVLNSVTPSVDYEGDMMNTRLITWDLTFTAKAYIWPPVKTGKVIRQANTNIYTDKIDLDAQKVYVNVSTGTGVFTTDEDITVEKRGVTGKVIYFANNSTGVLVVGDLNEKLAANDKIVGVYSNASYTVTSIDTSPTRAIAIVTRPDPITADANSAAYGFEEIFTEWPETLI
jgi:hypothetical protein